MGRNETLFFKNLKKDHFMLFFRHRVCLLVPTFSTSTALQKSVKSSSEANQKKSYNDFKKST